MVLKAKVTFLLRWKSRSSSSSSSNSRSRSRSRSSSVQGFRQGQGWYSRRGFGGFFGRNQQQLKEICKGLVDTCLKIFHYNIINSTFVQVEINLNTFYFYHHTLIIVILSQSPQWVWLMWRELHKKYYDSYHGWCYLTVLDDYY